MGRGHGGPGDGIGHCIGSNPSREDVIEPGYTEARTCLPGENKSMYSPKSEKY